MWSSPEAHLDTIPDSRSVRLSVNRELMTRINYLHTTHVAFVFFNLNVHKEFFDVTSFVPRNMSGAGKKLLTQFQMTHQEKVEKSVKISDG